MKAWLAALWAKLKPGLIAAGALILGILALVGISKAGRWKALEGEGGQSGAGVPPGPPVPQSGAAVEKKIEEDAREKTMALDPTTVVAGLKPDTRAGIDAAREAGRDAAREALHGGGSSGGG